MYKITKQYQGKKINEKLSSKKENPVLLYLFISNKKCLTLNRRDRIIYNKNTNACRLLFTNYIKYMPAQSLICSIISTIVYLQCKYCIFMQDELTKKVGKGNSNRNGGPFESTHIKFRYLLTADGFGAPWKKTPQILFSNCLLLRPFSQKIQWFYDKMIPGQNFVQINENLSDLLSKIQLMNKNDTRAKLIVVQGNKLAQKYLTVTSIEQFTRVTLQNYAAAQKLKMVQQDKDQIKKGDEIMKVLKNLKQAIQTEISNKQISTAQTKNQSFPKKNRRQKIAE